MEGAFEKLVQNIEGKDVKEITGYPDFVHFIVKKPIVGNEKRIMLITDLNLVIYCLHGSRRKLESLKNICSYQILIVDKETSKQS